MKIHKIYDTITPERSEMYMLLTADIGNTNIKFGIFDGRELKRTLTISCSKDKTADEYGVELYSLIRVMGIHRDDFSLCQCLLV